MEEPRFASRMQNLSGNAIREIFHLLSRPEIISFAGGNPAPSAFPVEDVARLSAEVLAKDGRNILQYGATDGYALLRESYTEYIRTAGVVADVADTMIISGSQQGIDLLCKAFIDPGDVVLVEQPTYLAVLHILATYQAHVIPVRTDDAGIDMDDLAEKVERYRPKLVYLVPTFQNPTGRTLPLEKRKAVADLAARTGVVVIEDDPYRDLRYAGAPLPAIKSFDASGRVVYLSSVSKIISPGMRVGIAVAEPRILRKMVIGKQATDVHTSNLTQAIVDAYMRQGLLLPHIEEIRKGYRVQLDAMLAGFEHFPRSVSHTTPEGGLFVWVELPQGADALQLLPKAVARNVAYVPGVHFYADGSGLNTMRLNFSHADAGRIEAGMKALGALLHEELGE